LQDGEEHILSDRDLQAVFFSCPVATRCPAHLLNKVNFAGEDLSMRNTITCTLFKEKTL